MHKSFRGFFVGRVLKENLRGAHPLLNEWLEQEVLYFLGGFAPTEPGVGERLWARFLRDGFSKAGALRRNMLVAYLYTRLEHDGRKIVDAEIADADFGRLRFTKSRMSNVRRLRERTVMALTLLDVHWTSVELCESDVEEWTAHGGPRQPACIERVD